jgi:hypothetical protein
MAEGLHTLISMRSGKKIAGDHEQLRRASQNFQIIKDSQKGWVGGTGKRGKFWMSAVLTGRGVEGMQTELQTDEKTTIETSRLGPELFPIHSHPSKP